MYSQLSEMWRFVKIISGTMVVHEGYISVDLPIVHSRDKVTNLQGALYHGVVRGFRCV
jgi:hypothetical protein